MLGTLRVVIEHFCVTHGLHTNTHTHAYRHTRAHTCLRTSRLGLGWCDLLAKPVPEAKLIS